MATEERTRRCIPSSRDEGICRRCGGDHRGGPIPCICYTERPVKFESGASVLRQVHRALRMMPWTISTDKLEQIEEEGDGFDNPGPSDPTRGELIKIREFLETISAKLAGGPLEGTRVSPLYDHPAYIHMFERYHSGLRNALTSLAIALRNALTRKMEQDSMLCDNNKSL
ncbi:unnamed protein product [Arctia plantaginis]|uniref:Uncharacterized protein n=1 Tax=Arctia plantaginis TaxID=874455 RepID=A0A8S1A4I6_ARCPL|nr:unnamed protein product [Arctia plantaginis]